MQAVVCSQAGTVHFIQNPTPQVSGAIESSDVSVIILVIHF